MKFCVLIPTYNEKDNITELIEELEEIFIEKDLNGHILIVDGKSPDGTGKIAQRLAKEYDNITVIYQRKRGLGRAYNLGIRACLRRGFDALIQMDGDLSHDSRYIPLFLNKLKEDDVVIGSRYMEGGGVRGWGLRRRSISKIANVLTRTFLGLKVKDATSGYRAWRRRVLESLDLSNASSGFSYQIETLYFCTQSGYKIGEIPISFWNRKKGRSKLGFRDVIGFLFSLVKLRSSGL